MAGEDAPDIADEVDAEIDIALLEGLGGHQHAVGLGAEIDADLAHAGPLAVYMVEVRARAVAAIKRFTAIDLGDVANLRDCQDAVRAYLDVMDFIKRSLADAERAGEVIAREMSETEGNPD
jgi:hypothetical protein